MTHIRPRPRTVLAGVRPRTVATAAAVLGVALVASGCGGSSHKAAAPTTVTPTTKAPPTTPAPTTTTTTTTPLPVAPLTGLPVSSPSVLTRSAVVIKIDNVLGALPQTGVNEADVVYEEMVEGGLTRLAAVFQSQLPDPVGPIRSGRSTDVGIVGDLNRPVLVYSGANADFLQVLAAAPVTNVNADNHPTLFFRQGPNQAPHNYFADATALEAATPAGSGAPPALFTYRSAGQAVDSTATPLTSATITFPAAVAKWTWDPTTSLWERDQNGSPDLVTAGTQLSAANVIVETIPYHTALVEVNGTIIPEGDLIGSGKAWVLTDGKVVAGTWTRSSLTAVTSYTDAAGQPIAMTPGQTWVELLPTTSAAPTFTP